MLTRIIPTTEHTNPTEARSKGRAIRDSRPPSGARAVTPNAVLKAKVDAIATVAIIEPQ